MEKHYPLTPSINVTPFSIAIGFTNFVDGHMRLALYEGDYRAKEDFKDETKRLVIEAAMKELDDCKAKLAKLYNDCVPKNEDTPNAH